MKNDFKVEKMRTFFMKISPSSIQSINLAVHELQGYLPFFFFSLESLNQKNKL